MAITHTEIVAYYKVLYFNNGNDDISRVIKRAYRDFNRTLRDFSKHTRKEEIKDIWFTEIKAILNHVRQYKFKDQDDFDSWHKVATEKLCNLTSHSLTIGQSQKWINMSIKYAFVVGESSFPGITTNYQYFHFPIDNIIQDAFHKKRGIPPISIRWSRIDSYSDYLNYQQQIRKLFPGEIPFEVEFRFFNRPDAE